MRKSEFLPTFIQQRIDERERLTQARALARQQKPVNDALDAFYHGKASFRDEVDTQELNTYMNL